MRKQLIGALIIAGALLLPSAAQAADGPAISLNGQILQVQSEIVDSRTLVGVRGVLEAMGAKVSWIGDQQLVVATFNGSIIELAIGANTGKINGRAVPLDVPARIENGRTMIPVRFVAEALGARVGFDANSQTVVIATHGGVSVGVSVASRGGDVSRDADRLRARAAEVSKGLLGSAYVFGGSSPAGFDCSGFTSYVFRQLGIELPRTAAEQFGRGQRVTLDQLQAGDLMFWDTDGDGSISHVGIYVGNGNFIHAENSGTGVVTTSVNRAWWVPRYVGARRIIK